MTGMFTTKEDATLYDSWTKKDIYEAYLLERQARVNATDTANKLRTQLAEMRHQVESSVKATLKIKSLSPKLKELLNVAHIEFFDNAIVCHHFESGVCCVNSASVKDVKFNKSVLRHIKTLINTHDSIAIASSVKSIEPFMNRLGFSYNTEKHLYIRSAEWVWK